MWHCGHFQREVLFSGRGGKIGNLKSISKSKNTKGHTFQLSFSIWWPNGFSFFTHFFAPCVSELNYIHGRRCGCHTGYFYTQWMDWNISLQPLFSPSFQPKNKRPGQCISGKINQYFLYLQKHYIDHIHGLVSCNIFLFLHLDILVTYLLLYIQK